MADFGIEHYTQTEKIYLGVFCDDICDVHSHNFLELVYVLSGSAKHTLNNDTSEIKKGNYFVVDYDAKHGYKPTGSEPFRIINCLFLPGFIDKTLRECRRFDEVMNNYLIHNSYKSVNLNPANRIFFDNDGSINILITKMLDEFNKKSAGYLELLRCNLIEIIIHTIRKANENNKLLYNSTEKYIADYINENYMNKITLKDISAKLNYSVPYLSKLFKDECGMTFEHFLQKTRVDQSCRLLANTDKKINDIAECVGYTDIKFFTSVFKKFTNISPREYRKLHR